MQTLKNKIIIVGADHHNTLAAIRCFGSMDCRIEVLFTSTTSKDINEIKCSYSKYCKGKASIVSRDEKAIVEWLMKYGKEDGEKVILFPCTDFVQYAFDLYYNILEKDFIFPGIINNPGRVSFLMDKWNQSVYAKEHHFPMAKTWEYNLEDTGKLPQDMIYPCIVKPDLSAHGSKADISICKTSDELYSILQTFKKKGYCNVLIQQFIKKDYEVCAFGCLVNVDDCEDSTNDIIQKANYGCYIRKLREYPIGGGGSLTYAVTIEDARIHKLLQQILFVLYLEGFRGNYDIEFLVCSEEVYLNEINFRHSGNGFALIKFGIPAPYISCLGLIGNTDYINYPHKVKAGLYLIDELNDIEHIREYRLNFFSWAFDYIRSKAYAKFMLQDLPGTLAFYRPMFRSLPKKVKKFIQRKGSHL